MVSRSKGQQSTTQAASMVATLLCFVGSEHRKTPLCTCMVQVRDQLDPEYFVAAHQCTDGSWAVCSYADGLQAFDGTLQHRIGERRPVICGPVAGQSAWVAELEGDTTAVQLTAAVCGVNDSHLECCCDADLAACPGAGLQSGPSLSCCVLVSPACRVCKCYWILCISTASAESWAGRLAGFQCCLHLLAHLQHVTFSLLLSIKLLQIACVLTVHSWITCQHCPHF